MSDGALVDHYAAVDDRSQRPEFVSHEEHRAALVDEPTQRRGERLLAGRVDAGGWLVEHQQIRVPGEGAGDQCSLLLTAGESGDRIAYPIGQTNGRERLGDREPVRGSRRPQEAAAGEPPGGDHFTDGRRYAGTGTQALRHISDPEPIREPCLRRAE